MILDPLTCKYLNCSKEGYQFVTKRFHIDFSGSESKRKKRIKNLASYEYPLTKRVHVFQLYKKIRVGTKTLLYVRIFWPVVISKKYRSIFAPVIAKYRYEKICARFQFPASTYFIRVNTSAPYNFFLLFPPGARLSAFSPQQNMEKVHFLLAPSAVKFEEYARRASYIGFRELLNGNLVSYALSTSSCKRLLINTLFKDGYKVRSFHV